jgi:hypothetical protein
MCDLDATHVKNVLVFFHYNITGSEISPDFEKLLLMSCLTLWKSLDMPITTDVVSSNLDRSKVYIM